MTGLTSSNITLSLGETVNCHVTNRKLGTIVVVQDTQPKGEPQDFAYTAGGGLSPSSFSLDDDSDGTLSNTRTFDALQPGSGYSIAQSTPAGWNPAQVSCSDGSPPTAIDVTYGETVTCTFTSRLTDSGTITVAVQAQPKYPYSITFQTSGFGAQAPSSFLLDDSPYPNAVTQRTFTVHPGSAYGVAQTLFSGYDLTSATCSDGSPVSAIDVSAGEDVTCTFINRERPRVIVALNTQPAQENQVFTFTPSSGFGVSSFSLDNDGFQQNELPSSRGFYLPPGHHSVSIDPIAGWNVASSGCTNGSPVSDIAVQYGDAIVTCTFTVEPVNPGSLTLILDTAPDDDTRFGFRVNGGSFYSVIQLQDNGNPSDGFDNHRTVPVSAYAHYTVSLFATNPSGTSYRQVQATCSDGSPISDLNISPGESVTCTLVYAKPQSITVVQDTVPDDPQDFSYTTRSRPQPVQLHP